MSNIGFSTGGLPETILAPERPEILEALTEAIGMESNERRDAVTKIVAANPRSLFAWALLGDLGRDRIEAYAAYRIGYHRGLDALRQSGWRGSGYVRADHQTNHGFLHALYGLQRSAANIGEADEADRCATFLLQLDPEFDPNRLTLIVDQPLLDPS